MYGNPLNLDIKPGIACVINESKKTITYCENNADCYISWNKALGVSQKAGDIGWIVMLFTDGSCFEAQYFNTHG